MEPIRVQLRVQDEEYRELQKFIVSKYGPGHSADLGFEGITGTLVYATSGAFGGWQVTVELDTVHPVFGWSFGKCVYMFTSRTRDVVADIISDHTRADVGEFARFCEWAGWNALHDSDGDPLTWEQVAGIMEARSEHWEAYKYR